MASWGMSNKKNSNGRNLTTEDLRGLADFVEVYSAKAAELKAIIDRAKDALTFGATPGSYGICATGLAADVTDIFIPEDYDQ